MFLLLASKITGMFVGGANMEHTRRSKAVANGAVSFYLQHFVSARVMKMTYGTEVNVEYRSSNPEHYARRHSIVVRPSGRSVLRHAYSSILKKVSRNHALAHSTLGTTLIFNII